MADISQERFINQLIDVATGEIQTQIKIEDAESLVAQGGSRLKITSLQVKNNRFTKLFNLGAHCMAKSDIFNRATRIMMLLSRDAGLGGRVYTSPKYIAEEIGTDVANVRKLLRQLESEDFILLTQTNGGGHCILLNPVMFFVGNDDDDLIAKRVWAKERSKRLKEYR